MENEDYNHKEKVEKKKKSEVKLPHCVKAPSAEHGRAFDEDEPCDDGRASGAQKS